MRMKALLFCCELAAAICRFFVYGRFSVSGII